MYQRVKRIAVLQVFVRLSQGLNAVASPGLSCRGGTLEKISLFHCSTVQNLIRERVFDNDCSLLLINLK